MITDCAGLKRDPRAEVNSRRSEAIAASQTGDDDEVQKDDQKTKRSGLRTVQQDEDEYTVLVQMAITWNAGGRRWQ